MSDVIGTARQLIQDAERDCRKYTGWAIGLPALLELCRQGRDGMGALQESRQETLFGLPITAERNIDPWSIRLMDGRIIVGERIVARS